MNDAAGRVSTFTGTVLAFDASSVLTLSGVALDPATQRGSVRSVRFELAGTCTAEATSVNAVVQPLMSNVSASANLFELYVPLVNTSGLSGGQWSVCVDWVAASVVPTYVRVGDAGLYVTVGEW